MSSSPTEPAESAAPGAPSRPITVELTLPTLGTDVLEAIVVAWEKHPGDQVEDGEPVCIVSAEGLRAAVASSTSGRLVRLLAGVGARVGPGASLAQIESEQPVAEDPQTEDVEAAVEAQEAEHEAPKPPEEDEEEPSFEPPEEDEVEPSSVAMSSFHSPAVRRLADAHGVDLELVPGTGAGGRVRREDVLAYLARRPAPPRTRPANELVQCDEKLETSNRGRRIG